jgi:hypothetical protein
VQTHDVSPPESWEGEASECWFSQRTRLSMGCSGEPTPEPGLPIGWPFGAVPTPEFRLACDAEVPAALFELELLFWFEPAVVPVVAPAPALLAEGAVDVPVPVPALPAEPEAAPLPPPEPPPLPPPAP